MSSVLFAAMIGLFAGLGGRIAFAILGATIVGAVCVFEFAAEFSWESGGWVGLTLLAFNLCLLAGYAVRHRWLDAVPASGLGDAVTERSELS